MRKTNLSLFVIVVVLAAVSLWSTTDLLRKNDQASILAGALAWAGGEPGDWRQHYQFDKTYVLYAYNAAWLALARWSCLWRGTGGRWIRWYWWLA
jgi:hypothetical protein